MVKTTRKQPRSQGLPKAKGKRMMQNVSRVSQGLDLAGRRYLALLEDPCAADLVPPTYGGTGSGYLMRTKQLIIPAATAVDGLLEYTPGWAQQCARLSTVTTTGNNLTTVSGTVAPSQLTAIADQFRAVAACIKIYYTGSELARAGMIFGTLIDAPSISPTETLACPTLGYSLNAARFVRLGSEMHEFRWCPNEEDQTFVSLSTSASPGYDQVYGSTLQVGFVGVPAGSVSFEITTVWEWQPKSGLTGSSGIVSTPRAPISPQPLNATLHKLGNLAEWATKPMNQKKLLTFGQGAYNMYTKVRPALAALAL